MRPKSFAAAALLALAVAAPSLPAVSASAAPAAATVAVAEAKPKAAKAQAAKKAKKAKQANLRFNLGGKFVAADAALSTVTFVVHGGKDKSLRKTSLIVQLGENARVLRNDAPATLADFVEGDRVRAKGTKVDGVYVAKRVKAVSPEVDDDTSTTPAPAPEEPAPAV